MTRPCRPRARVPPPAEEASDVAAFLVPRVREVPAKASTLTGGIQSQYIQFLTKPKAFSQIIAVRWLAGRGGARLRRDCARLTALLLPPASAAAARTAESADGRAQEPFRAGGMSAELCEKSNLAWRRRRLRSGQ